jgi:hypothetical protein
MKPLFIATGTLTRQSLAGQNAVTVEGSGYLNKLINAIQNYL